MKKIFEKLKSLYIQPELQFRVVVQLLILITLEGVFIGWGFMRIIALTRDWQRANLVWDFFWTLFWLLVPLILVNVIIGLYWSSRIARPLRDLENGLKALGEGDLSTVIESHPEDALGDLVTSFNETTEKMKQVINRDQRLISEVLKDLKKGETAHHEELKKIMLSVRSKLSVVDQHFTAESSK